MIVWVSYKEERSEKKRKAMISQSSENARERRQWQGRERGKQIVEHKIISYVVFDAMIILP